MARMQSMQSQCCCCSISVFSALFGIIMLSTGICLVLNYRIMEVDTTGLPPEWQNEEGKRIVGIILICCGLAGMALSTLVTALYFTVCSKGKATTSVMPSEPVASAEKHPTNHPSPDPHSTEVSNNHLSHSKHNSSRHGKRPKKKRPAPPLKGYRTKLAPHQEVVNESETRHENVDLDESSRSVDSSNTSSSKTNSYFGDKKLGSQDVMETSLLSESDSPFVISKPETSSDFSRTQVMLKTKTGDVPNSPVRKQPLLSLNAEKLATQDEFFMNKPEPEDLLANKVQNTKSVDLPSNSNDPSDSVKNSNTQSNSVLLKDLPPPPIPATSLTLDSDEEVSQIDEIKQLDKDVANLLA